MRLWKHQLEALQRTQSRDNYALFFEQGAGKTLTAIKYREQKCTQAGKNLRTLVLCPPIVIENWRREFLAHSELTPSQIHCLRGPGSKRATLLKQHFLGENYSSGIVAITNYETLNMPAAFPTLSKVGFDMIIFDESHKCKDLTSKRTQRAVELSRNAQYRLLLSGTPIVNKTFDIFSQFLIMDGGETFGKKIREFKEKYFIDENAYMPRHNYFPNWQPRIGAMEEINEKIAANSMRVKKSECLDLPPFIRQRVDVELEGEQKRVYAALEKDMVAALKDGSLTTADMALKQGLRLQQVVSGFVASDDGTMHDLESPKLAALEECLDQIGPEHKVIIWAVFRRDYEKIRALLTKRGTQFVEATGAVSEERKTAAVQAFDPAVCGNQNGSGEDGSSEPANVLLANPASAGIGANLTTASYAIFYSRGFSLENDLQAEARNYRGGSDMHDKVTRIDIVCRGTIDEMILDALSQKLDVSEYLLTKLKRN